MKLFFFNLLEHLCSLMSVTKQYKINYNEYVRNTFVYMLIVKTSGAKRSCGQLHSHCNYEVMVGATVREQIFL